MFALIIRVSFLILLPAYVTHFLLYSPPRAVSGGTWSKMVKEEPVIDYFDVQD